MVEKHRDSLKKWKWLVSLPLVMILILVLTNVYATPLFPDLKHVPWAKDQIVFLYEEEVVTGLPSGEFGVSNKITRGDAALMLARAKGLNMEEYRPEYSFPDVSKGIYYEKAIQATAEAGYIDGYPNGDFGPKDHLTREQMAKVIAVAFDLKSTDEVSPFEDISTSWAKVYIRTIAANGISNGVGDGTKFNPKQDITRAEFSVMLARAMNDQFKLTQPEPVEFEVESITAVEGR